MASISILLLIALQLVTCDCEQDWTALTEIKGQLREYNNIPCPSCQYSIKLYSSYAVITVRSDQSTVKRQVPYSDVLGLWVQQMQEWFSIHFISGKYSFSIGYAEWRLGVGLQWQSSIDIPQEGIHIKGISLGDVEQQQYYVFTLPLLSLIYGGVLLGLFPMNIKSLRQKIKRMGERVLGISLVVVVFKMQTIVLMEMAVAMVYIVELQSDLWRIAAYFIWMMGMAAVLLYIMVFTLILVKKYQQYKSYNLSLLDGQPDVSQYNPNPDPTSGCTALILVSLVILPLLLCFIAKGLLFYLLLSMGMGYQYILGYQKRVYPSVRYIALDMVSTAMMMMFTACMPIFGYQFMPLSTIVFYWIYQCIITVVAYKLIKARLHGTIQQHQHQEVKQESQAQTTQDNSTTNKQDNQQTIQLSASNL